jgi:hypothetical protein
MDAVIHFQNGREGRVCKLAYSFALDGWNVVSHEL